MKNWLCLCLGLATTCIVAEATANTRSCEQRENAIRHQMTYAKKYNNSQELAGLERALAKVKRHCSNSSWQDNDEDEIRQKERKVETLRRKLDQAELDLDSARDD